MKPAATLLLLAAGMLVLAISPSPARADDWIPLWTTAQLSQARGDTSATSADGYVLVAGGFTSP